MTGREVYSLSLCGAVHLTGTSDGIYRETGGTWVQKYPINSGFLVVDAHASHCTSALATAWGSGIYQTLDGGNSWSRVMGNLPDDARWSYGPAYSTNGRTVFLGTFSTGIFEALVNDQGVLQATWQRSFAQNARIPRIVSGLNGITFALVWDSGLYRRVSENQWTPWMPSLPANARQGRALLLDPISGNPRWVGGDNFLVELAESGWRTVGFPGRTDDLERYESRIFVARESGVYEVNDQSLTLVGNYSLTSVQDIDVYQDSSGLYWLYAATGNGIWRYPLP